MILGGPQPKSRYFLLRFTIAVICEVLHIVILFQGASR